MPGSLGSLVPPVVLVLVLVLVGVSQELVLAQRGLCAGNLCFAVFQEPADFPAAQRVCADSGGQLVPHSRDLPDRVLRARPGGRYWVDRCQAVSVPGPELPDLPEVPQPCSSTLSGFICQYSFQDPCGAVRAGGGIQVNYTTPMDFQAEDSDSFPPGTVAVVGGAKGRDPDSKLVCFSGGWTRAPWSCEVLNGGCQHTCTTSGPAHTCTCPPGKTLHHNNITCTAATPAATPPAGPCEAAPCEGAGQRCVVTRGGGRRCECLDGFELEGGACVDVSVCERCEHMLCEKVGGVYGCRCRRGFAVAPHDPTRCEQVCQSRDCPARCVHSDRKYQCFCPLGYIQDVPDATNSTPFCTDINECETGVCDHDCANSFGSFRCLCDAGFRLRPDGSTCEPLPPVDDDDGSGSAPHPYPTPPGSRSAPVPQYVKTGGVLGIAVFVALSAALLVLAVRNAFKRCGKFELSTFKHPDIDIYYLQQVSTETYKKLSTETSDQTIRCSERQQRQSGPFQ